jgi:hypothetical protein
MLRLILDSHPRIAIPPETGFMGGLRAAKQIPHWKFGAGWYERVGWTEAEVDERLREFYSGMFARYAAGRGKQRWGEKTPFHTEHITEMGQVFPDAVFVGIVRHPGAVASSLRKRFHYTFPEAVDYWRATNRAMVRAAGPLGDRFVLLRYEDLVLHREPVLRELVRVLDEPWSDDLLRHHQVQREQGAPRAAEGSTIVSDPVDADRASQWVNELTADDRRALGAAAGVAALFGYELSSAEVMHPPQVPAGAAFEWLVDGMELRELAERRAEELQGGDADLHLDPDADPRELALALARTERALARARSRRAVRWVDALRRVQQGRSVEDVRAAWALTRRAAPDSEPRR